MNKLAGNMLAMRLLFSMASTVTAAPGDQAVFTDFETINASNFVVGSPPATAHFTGGFSGFAGIAELYHSGIRAWMVDPGGTGTITFGTPVATVNFFARSRSIANGNSVLTAFNGSGQVIATRTLIPAAGWVEVMFSGSIARIEMRNLASAGCTGCMNSIDDFGFTPGSPDVIDLQGRVKTPAGNDICAMVLASGQFMFSCNPVGVFSLTGLPREGNGTVKRQIYADGFFPKIDTLADSVDESVVMTGSGACPKYNPPTDPGFFPDTAGQRINIEGKVLLQASQTPICAMVLANGQHLFSCDGTGSYALSIPLDANGQFKLQVYADGFAPTIQTFDAFKAMNDVRMARAVECQAP